jgi:hypothetical protein
MPVQMHKMGLVARIGDSASLAGSILQVIDEPKKFMGDPAAIRKTYAPDTVAAEYEKLFENLMRKR